MTQTTDEISAADDIPDTHEYLRGLLEALLFVSDRPLPLKDLARAAKVDKKRAQELIDELAAEYRPRGIVIDEVAGGYVLRSNPTYSDYVRKLLAQRPVRLSRAQLETLAIIAYRQPVTRPQVDEIRGVDSGPVLKGLLERELVRILGKKEEPGRPLLYGTSQKFLELFSLQSLVQLPTLKDFTELTDESKRLFERKTGEDAPEGAVSLEDDEEETADDPADEEVTEDGGSGDDDGDDDIDDEDEDDDVEDDEDDEDDD